MNARKSFVVVSIVFGIFVVGCGSDASKDDPAVKKAFMGGPMPKGFMEKNGPGAGQAAGQKAAQEAAAKAAAEHAGGK